MNTDKNRELLWRTVPFVMAMLLLALTGIPASAIFGREKAAPAADAGAPIAQSIDVRVYRGIPYTGTLAAIDREGGEVSFAIAEQPSKGTVTLDGETFVYTSAKNKTGVDRFTYTATDAAGSTSAPAEVRITIARAKCGVTYDDMAESAAYTAAVDLAEHGVFVGAQVGSRRFFEPDRAVSRGEFLIACMKLAGLEQADGAISTGFADELETPAWQQPYLAAAYQSGMISGTPTEEGLVFRPEDTLSRAEAAVMLQKLLRLPGDAAVFAGEDASAVPAWAQSAVSALSEAGIPLAASDYEAPLTRREAANMLLAAEPVIKTAGLYWTE